MNERLQQQLDRPVLEAFQLAEIMQALKSFLAALRANKSDDETEIAWEDGEIDGDRQH